MTPSPPTQDARYVRRFLGVATGLVAMAVAFNLVVDPWDRFGWNRLGVHITASREFASTEVERFPHEALLVGNSRTVIIPVAGLGGPRFFNAAFEGATLVEIRLFLERHLRHPKRVVLNLDPYLLGPESDQPPAAVFSPFSPRSLGGYVASLKALEFSAKTLADGLAGKPPGYAPDGTMDSSQWRRQRDVDDPTWSRRQLALESSRLAGFRFHTRRVEELEALADVVRRRGGELVVYLSPMHEDLLPALETGEAGEAWHGAVETVRRIFPGVVDLTRSRFSDRRHFYRTDPVHFFPEIGLRFLREEVLGGRPGGGDGALQRGTGRP